MDERMVEAIARRAGLEKALEQRDTWLTSVLREPLYAEALAGPRYQELLRKANMS